ncbi:U-box domain-containing protein 33-like [Juglans microcarpa x Juglans regia]|uniref:U-box domain-containing protein 33-like n=1 Tax=Juglans microcarpa x Juglans regia TaxID=2249226 RepID=UPI001B7F3C47|nr:U-box domain-containing protein 33-like [Juglans microcarpa x Juglans regia]
MRSRSVAQDYNWDGVNNIGSTSSALNSINAFQGSTEDQLSSPKSTIRRSDAGGSCTSIELDALSRSASSVYSPRGVHDFTLSHQLPQQTAPTLMDHQVFGFSALSPNLGCSTSTSTSDPTKFASTSNIINGAQNCVADRSFDNSNYGKLQQVMLEAEKLTIFQQKVASQFREAMGQAQEELICRSREIEEAKVKGEELEKMKNQIYQVMEHIQTFQENQTSLEKQIAKLQVDRDNAIKKAEELRNTQGEYLSGNMRIQFSEFSPSVIKEATKNFDESLKIGGGGFGNVYRGLILQTDVAIKRLQSTCGQGKAEFQAEVRVLSHLSHPNLVKLIGCCPEESALVYEYLPNGSLLDRLRCRDDTPSIPWETRLSIIKELCSVLTYLHSRKPHSFVHGDLKPSNILLDENFVSKLSDFGICRELCHDQCSNKDTTLCRITRPKGTSDYIDPDFFETGKLTMKADVYSFGIILLELLTNRSPSFVIFDVKLALETGNLEALLDQSAGGWPLSVAKDLAELALKCCDKNRKNRPKLESDVWKVLESILSAYKFVASVSS